MRRLGVFMSSSIAAATPATVRSASSAGSPFASVPHAPPDAILGLTEAFKADTFPKKVNLGAGVYRDDDNKPYVLECVRRATPPYPNMDYTGMAGVPTYVEKAQKLAFGPDSPLLKEKRVATIQTLSGTGALHAAAEFLAKYYKASDTILFPSPTWANHNGVFSRAGIKIAKYAYYNMDTKVLEFDKLLSDIKAAPEGTMILFHACAHNPTGLDPTREQWQQILDVVLEKKLFPVIDMAYQGFASGNLDEDAYAMRLFAAQCPSFILCQSFAKNFGLYGQRTGAAHIVCHDPDEVENVTSQAKSMARCEYSTPPIHGALIVDKILSSPELTDMWHKELKGMADRMNGIRQRFVDEIVKAGSKHDWSHIARQIGMMAYTGLTKEQVAAIKKDWHIYMTDDGRAAISGINSKNVEYVANAFHEVTK